MMDLEVERPISLGSRGDRPALVESFGITGLYGNRTISLGTEHAATILIAKNGSGKTTLLGVLNAFLKGQLFRLQELEFDTIFCKLRDIPQELVITRSDLNEALSMPEASELTNIASRIEITVLSLFKFLTEEWPILQLTSDSMIENKTYAALTRNHGYNRTKTEKQIIDLLRSVYENNRNVAEVMDVCRKALQHYEILYLPTYRRVELAFRDDNKEAKHRRRRSIIDIAGGGLFTGDIQFGLADISDRLNVINEKIVFSSNNQYRQISADIINGLMDGTFDKYNPSESSIPVREDLRLLFSRVEQSRRYGPQYPVSVPDLEKLYLKDGVSDSSSKFLDYFLSQLSKVIDSTREVETRVQQFVTICNKYLSSDDISTKLPSELVDDTVPDGKRLMLSRQNLQVHVVSVPEERKIGLDALSSGEKQMISLFAKLFLYESPKIILIDEPELSLSIDWQRQILVDVVNSPLCEQLIAITHSPFVFDNELDPYAGSLKVTATRKHTEDFDIEHQMLEDDNFDE